MEFKPLRSDVEGDALGFDVGRTLFYHGRTARKDNFVFRTVPHGLVRDSDAITALHFNVTIGNDALEVTDVGRRWGGIRAFFAFKVDRSVVGGEQPTFIAHDHAAFEVRDLFFVIVLHFVGGDHRGHEISRSLWSGCVEPRAGEDQKDYRKEKGAHTLRSLPQHVKCWHTTLAVHNNFHIIENAEFALIVIDMHALATEHAITRDDVHV